MKEMKRWLALFLCVVMLIGVMPVSALAADETSITASETSGDVPEESSVEASTEAPSTEAPSTEPPTSESTEAPTTEPPTSESTEAPTTEPPTSESTEAPTTEPPTGESSEPTGTEETDPTDPTDGTTVPQEIAVTGITLDVTELKVPVGTLPISLTATVTPEDATDKTVTWSSSNEEVAFFDEDGLLNFGMIGEADITATAGECSATCHVTVFLDEEEITGYADENTIYLLAGGDFQEAGDHANSAANVTNILAQISQKYAGMDGFLFIGDYDCETHDSDTETANGITALMGAVQGSYSTLNYDNSVLVQGNHDYMDSNIDATGGHDFNGYSVYVLNEDDYPNGGGSQAGIQTLANNLKTWLNNKIGEGFDAPIFITSHLPLAYTPRTVTQGDAMYAKYIFDVLNDAGKNGLNIIFLHGHDHAYGPDNYMGGEAIYLPVGDKICIAEAGSTSAWTEETLNFTYMNAGYTGYYSDAFTYVTTAGTDKLTMTVFAITGDQVTVERYSEDGLYNLKSAGYDGSYSNTSVTNVSLGLPKYSAVYTSPQTIKLTEAEDVGSTNGTVVEVPPVVADDVTPSGNEWTTITEPTDGTTTYTYTLATSITAGEEYVIVANDDNVALQGTTSMGTQSVDISGSTMTSTTELTEWTFSGSSSGTIHNGTRYLRYNNSAFSLSTSSTTFTITDNGSNFRIQSGNYSFYYNGSSWTRSDRSTAQYVRLYQLTDTTTTGGNPGLYGMVSGELTYNVAAGTSAEDAVAAVKAGIDILYHNGDANAAQTFLDDGEGMTWTLDPNYDPDTPGDYAVTISYNGTVLGTAEVIVPGASAYYSAEGNGLYLVDMNTTADNAMAAVMNGITVQKTDADGNVLETINDADVTWKWVDTYNGADSGPYTVEILYNGTSLGTVEVKVNVKYETGINSDWTYIGESEGSGGTTTVTYTLDTDGIDVGSENMYIIVARDQAYLLDAGSAVAVTISSDGKTATTSTRNYEYYFTGSTSGLITRDGTNTLYQQNWGIHVGNVSDSNLDMFTNLENGYYRLYDGDGTARSLYYNGSSWTVTESNHTSSTYSVRLYKYTSSETTGGTAGGPIYALIEGNTVYTVAQGSSATKALAAVKAGITGYTASDENGTGKTELADSDLTWKWKNTFNGNSTGSYWVEISYQGVVLGTVEVQVVPGTVNNYPEYPDEGSVKVSKTATGFDFQSSGIAQVEVSASGVPIKKGADVIVMLDTSSSMTSHTVTGTSNTRAQVLEESLKNLIAQFKTPGDDGQLLDLRVAIADFNGFYGENHNASGTPYDRDAADMMSDDISYNANSEAQIYTGDGTLGAGAFIPVEDLADSYTLNYTSGTNYDYAFDAIYQMGTAIKEANTEERDLYVIFMSDGAAMQWNYYHSQGASSLWNNWITGAWDADDLTTTNLNCTTHAYYYDEVDHNGDGMRNEHRMANAIKGDPSETYEVIRKTNTLGTPTGETNMYMVPGLGATMFSISFDAQADTNVTEESMDKSIESLASEQTGTTQYYYKVTTADELASAFTAIGSEIAYAAYNARFVDQMGDAYNLQMSVSNYSVVDGTSTTDKTITPKIEIIQYDIYTRQDYLNGTITEDKIGDRKGTYTILETVTFSADGTKAYSDQIGGGTTNILADGTQEGYVKGVIYAKTFLYNTNATDVAVDGVSIPTGTKSDGTTTGTTNVLPSETFYWKMGTVQTSELAMRYYVYLEGSMEGTREGGSYPTNEFATLYYDNYLGNACKKDTVSPVMAWKEANVSYAFYLVDENGEIIVNQTTGQTGSFANKIAVTTPVVYDTILLNNLDTVRSIEVASATGGILPVGYELYDGTSVYTITINSNTTGSWEIVKGADKVASTYVTQYDSENSSAYSNALVDGKDANGDAVVTGHDYTHTIVWFAVLWKVQALPDAVVIDYGLPVDISVLTNDMFGENGKLAGVGTVESAQAIAGTDLNGHGVLSSDFGANYNGTYGTAKADATTGKVRYTLNTMEMDGYEKFAYAVNYTGNENAGYYYDTVTVIPATTIYYEDSFLTYASYSTIDENNDGKPDTYKDENGYTLTKYVQDQTSKWTLEGDGVAGATQSEDRPGQYSLTDANNIYGYDGVNLGMSMYSLEQARMVHVDANSYATAQFTFKGTGFDVISMTSNTTGTITVEVRDENGGTVDYKAVNTYYGYKTEEHEILYTYTDGAWVAEDKGAKTDNTAVTAKPENPAEGDTYTAVEQVWVLNNSVNNAIYQVPVIQTENLTWGTYTVIITATYLEYADKTAAEGYDLYLDAVRIYDPANDGASDGATDTTIEDAYKADNEGWPSYIELRNKLIDTETLGNADTTTKVEGIVFIDGDAEVNDEQLADYISYGPNNEVYLASGQSVAFILDTPANIAKVHIGIKSADGNTGTYTIENIAQNDVIENNTVKVKAGSYYATKTSTVNTTTDMYYDITGYKGDIIVISNTGDKYNTTGIISLTNIKSTYTSDPNGTNTAQVQTLSLAEATAPVFGSYETSLYMTPAAAALTLRSLNGEIEETEPEATEPETTVPEETEPETTIPEETEPETTVPEETEPETTQPEVTEPEEEESEAEKIVNQIVNQIVNTVRDIIKNLFNGWFR